MKKLTTKLLDEMVVYVSVAFGCLDPAKEVVGRLKPVSNYRMRSVERATMDDVVSILRSRWSSAGLSEARETVARLLAVGQLRRIGGAAEQWKVIRPERQPSIQNPPNVLSPYLDFGKPRLMSNGKRFKHGVCPMCGKHVDYKNRHNRVGSAHDKDECAMNRIRSVMED